MRGRTTSSARACCTSCGRRRSTRSSSTSRTRRATSAGRPACRSRHADRRRSSIYDLTAAVELLHAHGVRVIGRLVCFRDPIHAGAAVEGGPAKRGRPDAGRRPLRRATAASPTSRTPPCSATTSRSPPPRPSSASTRSSTTTCAARTARSRLDASSPACGARRRRRSSASSPRAGRRLPARTALLGASVFGVAATRPEEVAQDIPAMAREVDYVAPMVYPSHWGPGEYGVADPNAQPYDDRPRARSTDFVAQVRGTGARVVTVAPGLLLGRDYGPTEVRAQIKAARDAGVDDFILWDAAVEYTPDALDASAEAPALALSTSPPKDAPRPVRLADRKAPAPAQRLRRPRARASASAWPAAERARRHPGADAPHDAARPGRRRTTRRRRSSAQSSSSLWRHGYAPVSVGDLVTASSTCPPGTTPVAFTFDDSTNYQLAFAAGRQRRSRRPRSGSCSTSRARTPASSPRAPSTSTASPSAAYTSGEARAAVADRTRLRARQPHARPHPAERR